MEIKKHLSFLLLLLFFSVVFVACRSSTNNIKFTTIERLGSQWQNVELADINIDYKARCKVRFQTNTIKRSGACELYITHDNRLRLSILHPFGGLLLDIYINKEWIQVVNHHEKTYSVNANNEENRKKILGVNLEIAELSAIIWGRKIKNKNVDWQYQVKDNKIESIVKSSEKNEITIHYKKWLVFSGFLFPALLSIEEKRSDAAIVLAITQMMAGVIEFPPKIKIPPEYRLLVYHKRSTL